MDSFTQWFLEWAEGNPRIDGLVYETIEDNFSIGLYVSGIFLDMRSKRRFLSLAGLISSMTCFIFYEWLAVVTTIIQKDDFSSASFPAAISLMVVFAILFLLLINAYRQEVMEFWRLLSVGFFKYKDEKVDEEIILELAKSKTQKRMVFILVPSWMALAGLIGILGRTVDVYIGVAPNSTYINGVYMKLPAPLWHPFEVTSDFKHYVVLFGETVFAGILVGTYIGIVCFFFVSLQSIAIQLKILNVRIRKLHSFAYKLYKSRGGRKLGKMEMFADHSYRKCYNECLNECVAHHQAIIKGFNHIQNFLGLFLDLSVLFCSILVAAALLLLAIGTKPSVIALGLATTFVEVANITIICMTADRVKVLARSLDDALYDTRWQHLGKPASCTMMIMLERCKKPMELKSYVTKVSVNWETYKMVMNTAYSYLNLIVAMQERKI